MRYVLRDAAIGFVSGLLVAIGGSIKDAPYEGFELKKFIRSPIIGAIEAPILGKVFKEPHPALLGLSTIACERITVETYKLVKAGQGEYTPSKFLTGEWGTKKRIQPGVSP